MWFEIQRSSRYCLLYAVDCQDPSSSCSFSYMFAATVSSPINDVSASRASASSVMTTMTFNSTVAWHKSPCAQQTVWKVPEAFQTHFSSVLLADAFMHSPHPAAIPQLDFCRVQASRLHSFFLHRLVTNWNRVKTDDSPKRLRCCSEEQCERHETLFLSFSSSTLLLLFTFATDNSKFSKCLIKSSRSFCLFLI